MLVGVTISGADKDTSADDMRRLSAQYPFLEWAMLVGGHREAERPRYPSDATLDARMDAAQAAHFCGAAMREILDGRLTTLERFLGMRRIQLNVGGLPIIGEKVAAALNVLSGRVPARRPTFLVQVDRLHGLQELRRIDSAVEGYDFAPLFDMSGGRGLWLSPEDIQRHAAWARLWGQAHPGGIVGFAGGIAPDNVEWIVQEIQQAHDGPFWIDMESGVRTDDRLDLRKVERVLTRCDSVRLRVHTRGSAMPSPTRGSGDFSIGSGVWPGASKVVEEVGELLQVIGKLIATHGDAKHFDGSNLRERVIDEIADVEAALAFFRKQNLTTDEVTREGVRYTEKLALFEQWHREQGR